MSEQIDKEFEELNILISEIAILSGRKDAGGSVVGRSSSFVSSTSRVSLDRHKSLDSIKARRASFVLPEREKSHSASSYTEDSTSFSEHEPETENEIEDYYVNHLPISKDTSKRVLESKSPLPIRSNLDDKRSSIIIEEGNTPERIMSNNRGSNGIVGGITYTMEGNLNIYDKKTKKWNCRYAKFNNGKLYLIKNGKKVQSVKLTTVMFKHFTQDDSVFELTACDTTLLIGTKNSHERECWEDEIWKQKQMSSHKSSIPSSIKQSFKKAKNLINRVTKKELDFQQYKAMQRKKYEEEMEIQNAVQSKNKNSNINSVDDVPAAAAVPPHGRNIKQQSEQQKPEQIIKSNRSSMPASLSYSSSDFNEMNKEKKRVRFDL